MGSVHLYRHSVHSRAVLAGHLVGGAAGVDRRMIGIERKHIAFALSFTITLLILLYVAGAV